MEVRVSESKLPSCAWVLPCAPNSREIPYWAVGGVTIVARMWPQPVRGDTARVLDQKERSSIARLRHLVPGVSPSFTKTDSHDQIDKTRSDRSIAGGDRPGSTGALSCRSARSSRRIDRRLPRLFQATSGRRKRQPPDAAGVEADILLRLPGFDPERLKRALQGGTTSPGCFRGVIAGPTARRSRWRRANGRHVRRNSAGREASRRVREQSAVA